MNFRKNKRIIVVGGNAAGPAAAAKAKRVDPSADVMLFESSEFISTGTCEMPYVLSGEIDDYRKIILYDQEKFRDEKGVQVYTKHRVETIDRKKKIISVINSNDNNKYMFDYDKLIIATGSKTKNSAEINIDLPNVFTFKSMGDLVNIQEFINKNKPQNTVVIGSGYIGLEVTEALISTGHSVLLIEKNNLPFQDADTEIQKLMLELLNKNKVEFIGGFEKISFTNRDLNLSVNVDGRIIETDLIIKCTGVEPNTSMAYSSGIKLGEFGGISVNQKLLTSDPNIYAAGDCVEVVNRITNRHDYMPLATHAHEQGHIAGTNAAGGNLIYQSVVKNISMKFFDNTFSQVGLSRKQLSESKFRFREFTAVANNLIKVMPESKKVIGKIIVDSNTKMILSASFLGGSEVIGFADLISSMIYNKVPAEKLKDFNYNYTPPRSPFVNLLSILGRKISENLNE